MEGCEISLIIANVRARSMNERHMKVSKAAPLDKPNNKARPMFAYRSASVNLVAMSRIKLSQKRKDKGDSRCQSLESRRTFCILVGDFVRYEHHQVLKF
jgi:hypothetical protein